MTRPARHRLAIPLFLLAATLAGSSWAQQKLSDTLSDESPTFRRIEKISPCTPAHDGKAMPYKTFQLDHSGGPITIRMTGSDLIDPFLLLYRRPFDPANPCKNVIALDDDSGKDPLDARISVSLAAGKYTIVATTSDFDDDDDDEADFDIEIENR